MRNTEWDGRRVDVFGAAMKWLGSNWGWIAEALRRVWVPPNCGWRSRAGAWKVATVKFRFGATDIAIPAQVLVLARGRPVRVVWRNGVGGVTCEYGEGEGRRFVKWSPAGGVDLGAEAARLDWAGQYVRVPVVVDAGSDGDGSWMITLPLAGENAVTKRWVANPVVATRVIGEGLRALHDTLPVASCPFSWSAADRVADAHQRAEAGQIDPVEWDETHRPLDLHTLHS